jgi:hypothetical protein
MNTKLTRLVGNLLITALISCSVAIASEPPASPEVTATVKPYMDSYKLAGVIGIVADKSGKGSLQEPARIRRRRGEETNQRGQCILDRVDDEDVCRGVDHDARR